WANVPPELCSTRHKQTPPTRNTSRTGLPWWRAESNHRAADRRASAGVNYGRWLGVSDGLVGEKGQAVTDGAGVDELHVFVAADLAEKARASTEHERVDHHPQLVDEVVLEQRAHQLEAGIDDDVPVSLSSQRRDPTYYVAG